MKKKVIRPAVLLTVFLGALILFSIITNQTNEDLTTKMQAATLPVVRFMYHGTQMNELHGYVSPMDVAKMRDDIMPMDQDRMLSLEISTYGMELDKISYEIRGMDGERLVANGDITDYETYGNTVSAEYMVQNLIEENTEYMLILILQSGEQNIYYYCRIMQTEQYSVEECVDFALQFHDYTFRDDAADFIPTYMDPATGDATTLSYVDLSCTLKQITWADFDGEQLTPTIASIKEINDSYNVILLDYVISYTGENGESELYNVEEYYRLRQTSSRMYVLNFERRMNQIFRGENTFLVNQTDIQLGIRDGNVEYATSEAGDVIAFVQEGELWCFNQNTNELAQVFSFRSVEGVDVRENWNQHDIKIARIDEAGSVDFMVYGYMNRGDHEGQVGIGVYHYDGLSYTVEEEAFIPVTQSYEVLKAELGQLMYENDLGMLYLMMDGDVYQIDLNTLAVSKMIEGLHNDCYCASESNRYLAWVEADERYESSSLSIMDLKSGNVYEVSEGNDNYVFPLGFIDEDFIYGVANKSQIQVDAAGNLAFPMYQLKILDTSEESYTLLKTYQPQEKYIEAISISDHIIHVELAEYINEQYIITGTDAIMNREADQDDKVFLTSTVTEVKETQWQLTMKKAVTSGKVKYITSQSVILEENRDIALVTETPERYYVYVKGDVLLATDSISEAILLANDKMGIVVDSNQKYMWMRARKTSQSPFSNVVPNESDLESDSIIQSVSAMLEREGKGVSVHNLVARGQTPKEVLENHLGEENVLDLTGCTVEEMLFYVSNGSTVFAMTGANSAVVIVGYTSGTISYYDPQTQQTESLSWEEADALFQGAGNNFFSYLK